VYELSVPAARPEQLRIDFFEPRGKYRPRELVRDLADCLLTFPTVQFLGAAVPEGDYVIHAAYEDRVVREVEEFSLLTQRPIRTLSLLKSPERLHPITDVFR
jgi:hypothetical protein